MKEAVTLSIKKVPVDLLDQLRQRAKRNHRSLQGELFTIIEQSVRQNNPSLRGPLKVVRDFEPDTGSNRNESQQKIFHHGSDR